MRGKPRPSGKKQSATGARAQAITLAALEKAVRVGHGLPLDGADGLFRSGTARTVVEQCLATGLLAEVRDAPKAARPLHIITPAGVEFLLERLAPPQAAELIRSCLDRESERLAELEDQLVEELRANQQSLALVAGAVEALVQRVEAFAANAAGEIDRARERVQEWQERLARVVPEAEAGRDKSKLPTPTAEKDYSFQRALAQQMVFAWEETLGTAATEAIERALFNAGLDMLGRPGERVMFVPRHHECSDGALPGEMVEVVRPGWLLRDERGESVLAPVRVKRLNE